jgi:hypothetical protein
MIGETPRPVCENRPNWLQGSDLRRATSLSDSLRIEIVGVEFLDENGGGPGVRLRKRPPRKPKL